ncbi:MAG TPA: hypothetical protein VFM38_14800 [Candidatus Limnocylindrales bacterium]|nr:hypothetical protein [Candidatus Limnocylindrales bacterium]
MTRSLRLVLVSAVALLAAACSSGGGASGASATAAPSASTAAGSCPVTAPPNTTPEGWDVTAQKPSVFPQIINPSGSVTCGKTRLMFSFLDSQNVPVAKPDRKVDVKVFDLGADPGKAVAEGPATFIWAIEPRVGVYVIDVDLPTSGEYGVEFVTTPAGGSAETIRTTMEVQPSSPVTAVGDKAPASDTPTLDDVGGDVSKISTDPNPVPAFYERSIADAVAAKNPFVVAFATPKFCVSQQCGPTLDRLKPIAVKHPGVTVINVEPYELKYEDGGLQPVLDASGNLTPTKATDEWHLPTEPWVFVVDKDGVVTASFMLIFSDEELDKAMAAVE